MTEMSYDQSLDRANRLLPLSPTYTWQLSSHCGLRVQRAVSERKGGWRVKVMIKCGGEVEPTPFLRARRPGLTLVCAEDGLACLDRVGDSGMRTKLLPDIAGPSQLSDQNITCLGGNVSTLYHTCSHHTPRKRECNGDRYHQYSNVARPFCQGRE